MFFCGNLNDELQNLVTESHRGHEDSGSLWISPYRVKKFSQQLGLNLFQKISSN